MSKRQSRFAVALQGLLDVDEWITRVQWEDILYVNTGELNSWLEDRAVPSAVTLRSIFSIVEGDVMGKGPRTQEPFKTVLENFKALFDLPWSEISPLPAPKITHSGGDKNFMPRLGDVILDPVLDGFLRTFHVEPYETQKEVLRVVIGALPHNKDIA